MCDSKKQIFKVKDKERFAPYFGFWSIINGMRSLPMMDQVYEPPRGIIWGCTYNRETSLKVQIPPTPKFNSDSKIKDRMHG